MGKLEHRAGRTRSTRICWRGCMTRGWSIQIMKGKRMSLSQSQSSDYRRRRAGALHWRQKCAHGGLGINMRVAILSAPQSVLLSNRQWGVTEAHKSAYMQVDVKGVKPITCERGSWALGAKLDIERADLSERFPYFWVNHFQCIDRHKIWAAPRAWKWLKISWSSISNRRCPEKRVSIAVGRFDWYNGICIMKWSHQRFVIKPEKLVEE